ncbi:DUF6281 family protein [Streptomyces dysideae]|uniref:Uncharacterized protein n=1 Tax=Streptomyces dysideae TaxID=909626 RepID=A0A124IFM0_9ACTN|nr:DUF6281 family protein [Streptomyces dysideae]KUO21872.1 hypothetical protein AQJ91_06990 [Streptomyces dysideae]
MAEVLAARRGRFTWVLSAAAVVTVAVGGCTSVSGGGGGDSAASCVFLAEYANRTYSDVANVDFTVGDELGTATLPTCDDTPNDNDDGETAPAVTTAYAVEGLDPSIAIAVGEAPDDVVFVAVRSGTEIPPEVQKLIDGS